MKMELTTLGKRIRFNRRLVLQFLGLPWATLWHQAEPVLRDRMAAARRARDEERAVLLSGIKTFLKNNLRRQCMEEGCEQVIRRGRRCVMHAPAARCAI